MGFNRLLDVISIGSIFHDLHLWLSLSVLETLSSLRFHSQSFQMINTSNGDFDTHKRYLDLLPSYENHFFLIINFTVSVHFVTFGFYCWKLRKSRSLGSAIRKLNKSIKTGEPESFREHSVQAVSVSIHYFEFYNLQLSLVILTKSFHFHCLLCITFYVENFLSCFLENRYWNKRAEVTTDDCESKQEEGENCWLTDLKLLTGDYKIESW